MYEQDYIKIIREIIQNKLFRIYIQISDSCGNNFVD